MPVKVRYLENPMEGYKTVKAYNDGGVQKYKMMSIRGLPIEYPNNAIIQSISKRFMTQRGLEPIYTMNYGVDWAKFIGRDMTSELALDLESEIKNAMLVCPFVEDINVTVGTYDGTTVIVNAEVKVKDKFVTDGKSSVFTMQTSL